MVEGAGGAAEGRRLPAGHLADVQRLVLVVQVPVALVRHRADVVHGALLGDEGEQRTVGDPVVVESVYSLPVAVGLGGGVLVVEDEAPAGAGPPLEVQVRVLGPRGVGDGAVDGVEGLVLDLGDGVAVEGAHWDVHVVAVGVQACRGHQRCFL